jgi:uncharacterized membrane protein
MRMTLFIHILAGGLGLLSGFIALYAAKGASLHRKSGLIFVYAMLTMGCAGFLIAAIRSVAPAINIPAALMTSALVASALTTVRPPSRWTRGVDVAAMVVALAIGMIDLTFAFEAVANGGSRNGMPAFPFFLFGIVGMLAFAGDVRMMRSGPLKGAYRIARHLWRMCFALFIAALSFFIGQAQVFPKPIRIMPLLAMPILAVLFTMLYWLWRVRIRRTLRGIVVANAPIALSQPVQSGRSAIIGVTRVAR